MKVKKIITILILTGSYQLVFADEVKLKSEQGRTEFPYYTQNLNTQDLDNKNYNPITELGKAMKDNGIIYRGLLTAGMFNSGTTGVDPHEDAGGALFINAIDFDLEKLLNIPTAKIHTEVVIFPWAYPDSSSATHFGTYASSLMGGDQYPPHEASWKPWLSQLSYEQTILDGKLNFELGKSNILSYFLLQPVV